MTTFSSKRPEPTPPKAAGAGFRLQPSFARRSGLRDPSSAVALLRRVEGGRPDWDTYFMDITQVVKRRSNCRRRQVAAIIVNQRRIISTGYNGTPSGIKNCNEGGCPRCASNAPSGEQLGDCICAHAEENAIVQAAYYGVALKDSMLYCTDSPCLLCAKMIITAGIKEVVYETKYCYSRQVAALFTDASVRCRQYVRNPRPGQSGRKGRKAERRHSRGSPGTVRPTGLKIQRERVGRSVSLSRSARRKPEDDAARTNLGLK